jgi:predicted nucleic acid-binding protein
MKKYSAIFIDTWGFLALGYRRDSYHQQVKQIYAEMLSNKIPMYTSDYILDEVMTLMFKREIFQEAVKFVEGIFKAGEFGNLRIDRVNSEAFQAAWELRLKFQDKPEISFTDLTSMVIMRERGIQYVLTGDEHFIQVGMGFVRIPKV